VYIGGFLNKINVGIIGLGNLGLLHMASCLHMKDVEVVAVSDKSKQALKKAEKSGINNLYTEFTDLFCNIKDIDGVIISLPNFLHYESVKLALENDINVFVEKPLATTVADCKKIVELVRKSGKKLMVGYNNRFIEAYKKMKVEIENGTLGSLKIITLELILNGPLSHGRVQRPISEWWFDPKKSGGGALLDLGSHLVDLFHYFSGDSKVIFSHLDYNFNLPVEDGATIILESKESKTRGVINVGWFEKLIFPKFNCRIVLHGNADFLSSEKMTPNNFYIYAAKEGIKNSVRKISGKKIRPLAYTYYYESYYKEIDHFISCLKNDLNPIVSEIEGYKTMKIINDCYEMFNTNE